jgi:hypothetical protein
MSVRFAPSWAPDCPLQVIGFLELVNHVTCTLGHGLHWVELGGFKGESATLTAGFPQVERLDVIERTADHAANLRQRFVNVRNVNIVHARSVDAAREYKQRSVHCVYVDADHSYEGVAADLDAWYPKIRIGGYIAGHDYHAGFPGVMKAVNERFAGVQTFPDSSWLVRVA